MRSFHDRVARVNRRALERVGQVLAVFDGGREVLGLFEHPTGLQELNRPERSAPGLIIPLEKPCFVAETAHLVGIGKGHMLTVPAGRYRVEDVLPDGGGMTRLDLVPAQAGDPAPGTTWR
ncbi:MAG: head-tail joining protein [Pseudomonas sp.]